MRRWTPAMVLALAGSALTGAPATSAAAVGDPVTAIQHQMVEGRGVRVVVHRTYNDGRGWRRFKPTKGVVGFGAGKVVATDLVDHQVGGSRDICIGKHLWQKGPLQTHVKDKKWVRYPWTCELRLAAGDLRLDKPAVLAAVLSTTTSERPSGTYDEVSTTLHQGVMTFRRLWEVLPELRPEPEDERGSWPIEWRLWVGEDDLVRRAWVRWRRPDHSSFKGATHGQGWFGFVEDIRYADWGMKLTIKPPPPAQTRAISIPAAG
ncbi:hypothetical protein ACFWYW_39830 [Nonomuraea sp. NPDC059023]|uniref:hypothetical protein n=1 Tax=unclassified Nonomuraea TaxID=2593643 RepID=UPI0036BE3FB3